MNANYPDKTPEKIKKIIRKFIGEKVVLLLPLFKNYFNVKK